MRAVSLLAAIATVTWTSSALGAGSLRSDSKIDTAYRGDTVESPTWVVDHDAKLWRASDALGSPWTLYAEVAGYAVHAEGVSVAAWADPTVHNWVYFAVSDGSALKEFRVDGSLRQICSYPSPERTYWYTGHVEARSVVLGGSRKIVFGVTVTNGSVTLFYTASRNPTDACETPLTGAKSRPTGSSISAASDIASEVWPGFDSIYFFVGSTVDSLLIRPYYSGAWQKFVVVAEPGTGANVCSGASIAAASGIWSPGPTNRLYAFCTQNVAGPELWSVYTANGTSWTAWGTTTTTTSLRGGPYALGAGKVVGSPTSEPLWVFALEREDAAPPLPGDLIRFVFTSASTTWAPLARPPETTKLRGGIAAAPKLTDDANVRASLIGVVGGQKYLLEYHDRDGGAVADDWYNVGGTKNTYELASNWPHTEGVLAEGPSFTSTTATST